MKHYYNNDEIDNNQAWSGKENENAVNDDSRMDDEDAFLVGVCLLSHFLNCLPVLYRCINFPAYQTDKLQTFQVVEQVT